MNSPWIWGPALALLVACSSLKTVPEDSLVHVEPDDMQQLVVADQTLNRVMADAEELRTAHKEAQREKARALKEVRRTQKRVDRLGGKKQDAVADADTSRATGLHADLKSAERARAQAGERLTRAIVNERDLSLRLQVVEARVHERDAFRELVRAEAVADGGGSVKVERYQKQYDKAKAEYVELSAEGAAADASR